MRNNSNFKTLCIIFLFEHGFIDKTFHIVRYNNLFVSLVSITSNRVVDLGGGGKSCHMKNDGDACCFA